MARRRGTAGPGTGGRLRPHPQGIRRFWALRSAGTAAAPPPDASRAAEFLASYPPPSHAEGAGGVIFIILYGFVFFSFCSGRRYPPLFQIGNLWRFSRQSPSGVSSHRRFASPSPGPGQPPGAVRNLPGRSGLGTVRSSQRARRTRFCFPRSPPPPGRLRCAESPAICAAVPALGCCLRRLLFARRSFRSALLALPTALRGLRSRFPRTGAEVVLEDGSVGRQLSVPSRSHGESWALRSRWEGKPGCSEPSCNTTVPARSVDVT